MKLWVAKYQPKTLDEMVLSNEKKELLRKVINELPVTLLSGKPGTGKGCFMDILLNEKGCNYQKINASMENSIDDIREKVRSFATSFDPSNYKIVYLNEADRISSPGQDALRQLIEDTEKITRFFLVCNNENKITDALKSRCGYHISLNDPPGKEIFNRCNYILKQEGVKVKDKSAIVNLIKALYPDIRKIIGTLQANNNNGVIDKISYSTTYDLFSEIFNNMKSQDVEGVRKILKSNYIQYDELFQYLYEKVIDDPEDISNPGEFILLTGEYLFRDSQVAISEVNFMAYIFALMKAGCI